MQERPTDKTITTCRRCGDVIGAYEPIVLVSGGRAHITSRAGAPDALGHGADCYHHACYGQLEGDERGT